MCGLVSNQEKVLKKQLFDRHHTDNEINEKAPLYCIYVCVNQKTACYSV